MKENIFVTKSLMPPFEAYVEEIKDLWDSCMLTNMGEKHQRLQGELETFLKVPSLELVVNGHFALELALESLEKKSKENTNGQVITSPFTFISTTNAIVRSGFTPVFCDVNPVDFTIDVTKIESLITEDTVAILPIHVYGNVCDVEKIQSIGKKYDIPVIYDAAHSFGVEVDGRGIGSFGDISCFSFHATKVFHTVEGGAVCVNDPIYLDKIQALRNFGYYQAEGVQEIGGNGKMNEFSAAMGLCNLKYMDEVTKKRKKVYECYESLLKNKGFRLNPTQDKVKRNYAYFPLIVEAGDAKRELIFRALQEEGIFTRKYFYPLPQKLDVYKGKYLGETPVAQRLSESVLCLPLYPDLSLDDVERMCGIILNTK